MDLKKLRDMEITPSERANNLFRSRMEQLHPPERKKPGAGYFAAAAAVVLVLGLVFVLRFNQENTAVVLPDPAQTNASQPEATQPGTTQPETEVIVPENRFPAENTPAVHLAHAVQQADAVPAVHQPAENVTQTAPDLKLLSPQIRYRYQEVELTDFALLDVHQEIELETEESGPATLATAPSLPLLARVIREVKYVVNGDKPDLDRAGIKPAATALAYNQNGLLAHESRQMKQGIDKFKEMFKTE